MSAAPAFSRMNFEDFSSYVMGKLSIDPGFDADFYESAKPDELVGKLYDHMQETYGRRMDTMSEKVYPFT